MRRFIDSPFGIRVALMTTFISVISKTIFEGFPVDPINAGKPSIVAAAIVTF